MPYRLRNHLYWCVCGEKAVFLDLHADRYFALPGLANEAFLRLARRQSGGDDEALLQPLVSRGLLIAGSPDAVIQPPQHIDQPISDFLSETPKAPVIEVLKSVRSELCAAWLLRKRPLIQILEMARTRAPRKPSAPADTERRLLRLVSASALAALATKAHDRCLVRALGLRSRCNRHGLQTALVFGVRASPFAAHCWIQRGSEVLVGDFEQARLYTPILIIR